jgi:tetratricopeptide (TPR) repeat protein
MSYQFIDEKYMKKKIIFVIVMMTSLSITSCDHNLLDQVNPNAPTTESFWKTSGDGIQGINAAYAGIQNREITLWELFNYDMRSDEGYSQSPWTDLANVGKFIMNDYNIPFNYELWREIYRNIYRCNQVLTYVPNIQMDEALKKRILAEAKFIRGHLNYKLATLWGRVPIVNTIQAPSDRPEQGTLDQVWSQIEKDFSEAMADLPVSYTGADVGRVTKGGATAYLGKAYLQQKKWTEAAARFKTIIDQVPAVYDLLPNFKDNFTEEFENNKESLFEIQYANNNSKASGFPNYDVAGGDETSERAQFFGVRGIGWCDGQPTKWLLNEFLIEPDKNGNVDLRLQYTIFYNHPGEMLYGQTYAQRGFGADDRFWKKYTNYWKATDSYFSGINQRVIRLADVYLMYAECLNELNQTAQAIPYANLVRQRSNMNGLSLALTQTQFRDQLRHDRVMELAGESVRFIDMSRYGILSPSLAGSNPGNTPANVSDLDTEFKNFIRGKSEYLPIPLYEIDAYGGKLSQNSGW